MVEFPIEILRYILSFYENWRIIGNRFVNIEKLLEIPRPLLNYGILYDYIWSVELRILQKSYMLIYNDHSNDFSVTLRRNWENRDTMIAYYYSYDKVVWFPNW